jgi:hypothetical protein
MLMKGNLNISQKFDFLQKGEILIGISFSVIVYTLSLVQFFYFLGYQTRRWKFLLHYLAILVADYCQFHIGSCHGSHRSQSYPEYVQ